MGALAIAVLPVLKSDAHPLFERLVEGRASPALAASIAAGIGTLALVWRRRYEPAATAPRSPSPRSSRVGASPRRRR